MLQPAYIYDVLKSFGVSFWCGVPDSLLKPFLAYVSDRADAGTHLITANEGASVGVAAGFHLSTGKLPLVYMQNSGLGNAINPLLSLADEKVYGIPMLVMIGWRGEPGTKDEPQHIKQGICTTEMLDSMAIPYIVLDSDEVKAKEQLSRLTKDCISKSCPHVILVREGTFSSWKKKTSDNTQSLELSREDALTILANFVGPSDLVVSTTGKLSRELYELRDNTGKSHQTDFYTVGSMGHSSAIAFGLSLGLTDDRNVFCFDGDGAVLMHMGTLSTIGSQKPQRFRHIVFNNGVHESVGSQPTTGFSIDFPAIASACGYEWTRRVYKESDLRAAMEEMLKQDGLSFLEVQVAVRTRDDLGRPKTTPSENKVRFMQNIGSAKIDN
jgi:phosphonopyruvate decarboxylase